MKKILLLLFICSVVFSLAAEMQEPIMKNPEELTFHKTPQVFENANRDVPNWNFGIDPVGIVSNYFDYQPGSYNSVSLRWQADSNGHYGIFHARETAAATRRVYYTFIDETGNVNNVATIGTDDIHEGYPGIDIDPVTGDPIVCWHGNFDPVNAELEIVVSYDLFHLGSPGLWKTPFIIIDDSTPTPNVPSDQFNWPYAFIGPSPITGKRRVYVISTNYDNSPLNGLPSENVLIAYADFDIDDFNMQSELSWTYNTIPLMDDWHMGDPEWKRPNGAAAVSDDGKVAFFGYSITDKDVSTTPDMMYCFYNDNYGEGDFTYFEGQAEFNIDNPQNQDGTYAFVDTETGLPLEVYMAPSLCNHQNVIFTHDNTKLQFLGNMNMLIRPDNWYPDLPMMYPKVFTFDLNTQEFSFQDVYVPGAVPNDDLPMLPWDLDEDGQVDEFDQDGNVMWVDGWPIFHFDYNVAFHENRWQITKNEDEGWLACVWSDGLKARLGSIPEPGYEDWAEYPEIGIIISADEGETWSEPIMINAKTDDDNYAPQLDGMIPCYIYTGDMIVDRGDGVGRLHLMFLDDNSYGSSIQGHGENLGGTMMYAALDIQFGEPSQADPSLIPEMARLTQNYPNPFNPVTNIKYSLQQAGEVKLEVFNVKGQKVKTLVNSHQSAGEYAVEWNGLDDHNRKVGSGVYFYRLRTKDENINRKMLMLK